MLKVPSVLGVLAPNGVTCTVQVNVPCLAGVPPTIVPAAPKVAGMDRPGGSLPEVIVKVSTAPLLVSRNASYGWPTAAAGSTQTPLTSVPPLLPGEHGRVIGRDWACAGVTAPTMASSAPASSDPVAMTAATVFVIMSSLGNRVCWSAAGGQLTVSVVTASAGITARPGDDLQVALR